MNDDTEQHLNALHDLFNTPTRRSLEIASKSMEDAIEAFKNTVSRTIAPYGLNAGGSNGLEDGGRVARLTFFLLKRGLSEPKAHYKVMLKFDGTRITGSRHVEGQNWKDFFSGDIGTSSLLIEACESEAVIMAGELAQVLMKKFEDQ